MGYYFSTVYTSLKNSFRCGNRESRHDSLGPPVRESENELRA